MKGFITVSSKGDPRIIPLTSIQAILKDGEFVKIELVSGTREEAISVDQTFEEVTTLIEAAS